MATETSFKELRTLIRVESKRAKLWAELDQLITDDVAPAASLLAAKTTAISTAERQLEVLAGKIKSATDEAAAIITTAQASADQILDGARKLKEAAVAEKKSAGEKSKATIEAAERQAVEIVSVARSEAAKLEAAVRTIKSVL
jgi:hypothetical protein